MTIVFFATRFAFEYSIELANSILKQPEVKQVHLFLPDGFVSETQLNQLNKEVNFIPFNLPGNKNIYASLISFREIANKIRKINPDIIHVQGSAHPYFWLFQHKIKHIPIVDTVHDAEPHPGFGNFIQSFMRNRGVKNASKWFIHGQSLKDLFSKINPSINKDDIVVIPKGHYGIFAKYSEKTFGEEKGMILFFGNITKYKGIGILLESAEKVIKEFPDVKFVIAGKVRAKDSDSIDISHLNGLRNFDLRDYRISEEEVAELYQKASLLVLPYIEASQSGVLSIAFGFGKAIIATKVGALPEIIDDGITGLLIEPNNSEELSQAIIKLLHNDKLRNEIGKNALEYALNELSWEKISKQTMDVYEEVLKY